MPPPALSAVSLPVSARVPTITAVTECAATDPAAINGSASNQGSRLRISPNARRRREGLQRGPFPGSPRGTGIPARANAATEERRRAATAPIEFERDMLPLEKWAHLGSNQGPPACEA